MHAPAAPEKPEHRHFPGGPSAPPALADATKAALVDLDLAVEEGGFLGQSGSDQLAQLAARFGPGLFDLRTWAVVGDGCLQEGVGQEVISLAGHLRLGKLTFFWDDNTITDDGATSLSISEDVAERFRVANWHVIEAAIGAAKRDPRPR